MDPESPGELRVPGVSGAAFLRLALPQEIFLESNASGNIQFPDLIPISVIENFEFR